MLQIGSLSVSPPVLQAPMAGFTNLAYRRVVRGYGGAGLQFTEMINAKGFAWLDEHGELPDRLWGVVDEPRPLGVQIWALAYRSGEAWNEFGWANADFDALLTEALAIADADKRREIVAKGEAMIQEEGVTVQPYWRSLYRHMKDGLVGTDMHVSFEHHHYKWGWAA